MLGSWSLWGWELAQAQAVWPQRAASEHLLRVKVLGGRRHWPSGATGASQRLRRMTGTLSQVPYLLVAGCSCTLGNG